jgi:hypothetical protein
VKSPAPNQGGLKSVTARGSKDVFAAGTYLNSKGCLRTLIVHWTGSGWKQMTTPNPFQCDNELLGIGASAKGVESVGDHPKKVGSTYHLATMAMAFVNGAWKWQTTPNTTLKYNELRAVGMVPGKNQGWAVGLATNTIA